MAAQKEINIAASANSNGCFDLQFRKDTRRERTNSPTYYRWKAQFVITDSKENIRILEKIKNRMGCGRTAVSKNQARFFVQKIDDIVLIVIPFFRKNPLRNAKKKNFELWTKGVEIIYKNKGKYLASWKKNDLLSLIEIHKSMAGSGANLLFRRSLK